MPDIPADPKPPPRPRHDAAYKSLFAQRRTVEDTLRALGLAGRLDFSALERMPASFVTEHLGRRHADMLWRTRTVDETWPDLLVLIEFQSTVDRRMAFRMMNYAAGIWMGLEADHRGPGGEYPRVLPVVIYSGRQRWTAPTDIRDLLTVLPDEMLGSRARHAYYHVDLQTLGPSALPEENVLSMMAALERARVPKRLEELALSLADWAERVRAEELLASFRGWVLEVLTQRYGPEGRALAIRIMNQEGGRMSTLIERARQWGEELNQEWLEKGLRRGLERGRVEGERALVRRLVARRFGPDAAGELIPLLDGISDPEVIGAIAEAAFECRTSEEFRQRVTGVAGS